MKAIEELEGPWKLLVILPTFGSILAIIMAGIFVSAGQPFLAFWLCLTAFALFSGTLLVSAGLFYREGQAVTQMKPTKQTWSRLLLKLPLEVDDCRDLGRDLEGIRDSAFAWLSGRPGGKSLRRAQVRANIFLPDYNRPQAGVAFLLSMPDGLRVGMDGHPDEKISFQPGQGATGTVFAKQEWCIAQTLETPEGDQEFEELYRLTPEHQRTLHPELRWVVSFPLAIPDKETGKKRVAGVLNVDGLTHQFKKEELNQLVAVLSARVGTIADKISQLTTVRVSIMMEG
jgi:hypothetical protein